MKTGIYCSKLSTKIIEIVSISSLAVQWTDNDDCQCWMDRHNAEENMKGFTYIGEV